MTKAIGVAGSGITGTSLGDYFTQAAPHLQIKKRSPSGFAKACNEIETILRGEIFALSLFKTRCSIGPSYPRTIMPKTLTATMFSARRDVPTIALRTFQICHSSFQQIRRSYHSNRLGNKLKVKRLN